VRCKYPPKNLIGALDMFLGAVFFWCDEKDTQRFKWQAEGRGEAATSQSAAAARSPD
jgi:hypothetical protein